MKKPLGFYSALALGAALPSLPLSATTMTSLASFGGIEEPAQIYYPATNTFVADSYDNITDVSSGKIQVLLRYSSTSWDGDRTTGNTDRQRGEVKDLGAHQLIHETYEYTTTWKTNSAFVGSGAFCHITQLKPYNGEGSSGAPLVVTGIEAGTSSAAVRYWPASASTFIHARDFSWSPGTSTTVKIRITTTAEGETTGQVRASINGDALQGVTNVEVCRPLNTTEYYPKWGLYRGASTTSGFSANDYVQHSNVTANKITLTPIAVEAESLTRTSTGAATALQTDAACSGGTWVALNADGTGDYVDYTVTNVPAGTYAVKMLYKAHPSRGILNLKVDGTVLGSTLDQYSANPAYPENNFGTVTFASTGNHTLRLTVTGKNASSGAYTLSADKFTLVPQ
jgi:hypothetical protein